MHSMWTISIVTVAACIVGSQHTGGESTIDTRILNGKDVRIEDYPYQVYLQIVKPGIFEEETFLCGGIIIHPKVILTAAHCTVNVNSNKINVTAGTSYRNEGGVTRKVTENIVHEQFEARQFDYDIALVILEKAFEFSEKIQSIKLPEETDNLVAGESAVVTGWGVNSTDKKSLPDILQMVELPIIDLKECQHLSEIHPNKTAPITSRMICTSAINSDSCGGDSGGPLAKNGKVYGIVSWGPPSIVCNPTSSESFGVFTRVSVFRPWIDEKIKALIEY